MTQRQWLILILITAVLGAFWIEKTRSSPGVSASAAVAAPLRGFLAPDFDLIDLSGTRYRLSELRGTPILINFWASWCTPCRAEMPALERIFQEYEKQGFLILAVNATSQDSRSKVEDFRRRQKLSFPILLDESGLILDLYDVRALPSTFFVSSDGTIQDVIIGGPMAEALLKIRVQALMEVFP